MKPDATDSIIQALLSEPTPQEELSSLWQRYERDTAISYAQGHFSYLPSGFDAVPQLRWKGRILHRLERLTFLTATRRMPLYRKTWPLAKQLTRTLTGGPHYNVTVFRSACALAVLAGYWNRIKTYPRRFALIGDGSGFLGALIRRYLPDPTLYLIDLPKLLAIQAWTHRRADASVSLSFDPTWPHVGVVLVLPQDILNIPHSIDCAINILGFQEMPRRSLERYFGFLRARSRPASHLYCVNEEHRQMPNRDGVPFSEYPWKLRDTIYLDEPCPYFTHYLSRRFPLLHHFDTPVRHRITSLAP